VPVLDIGNIIGLYGIIGLYETTNGVGGKLIRSFASLVKAQCISQESTSQYSQLLKTSPYAIPHCYLSSFYSLFIDSFEILS